MPVETLIEIVTTFPDEAAALACAGRLVEKGFAACVQVEGPVRSTYLWEGRCERVDEWRCTCKTSRGARAACLDALQVGHPYDLPQIVVRDCQTSAEYAAWVEAATSARGQR